MIFTGQAAIDRLASEIDQDDPGASSHWRKYHSSFRFDGIHFEGIQGFGGCRKPYRGLRLVLHRLLQRRFRQICRNNPYFSSIDGLAKEITEQQGRAYDLDVLRQSLTLAFLRDNLPASLFSSQSTACVIGDGFAAMTTLLLASRSAGRVVLVNLTKTLLVDLWYLKLWMGGETFESSVDLVTDAEGLARSLAQPVDNTVNAKGRVVAVQAKNHELLRQCPVDIAINIASMQEMNPPVIAAYFDDLRCIAAQRKLVFYCCNREEKALPDGTTTRFLNYPWREDDQIIIDELCPWHQQYYSIKPPFYRAYDGPIRHRLVILS